MKDEMPKRLNEYERMARQIAQQMGHDPDQLVSIGQPMLVYTVAGLFHQVDIGNARPLWTVYLPVARAALGVELKA